MTTLSRYGSRTVPKTNGQKIPENPAPAVSGRESSAAQGMAAADPPRTRGAEARRIGRYKRSSVWREQVRSRLADLKVEFDSLPPALEHDVRREDVQRRFDEATAIVNHDPSLLGAWTGVDVEATWMRIHAIEVALVRLSTPESFRAKLPGIIDDGSRLLGEAHPRVKILSAFQKRSDWRDDDRECLAQSVRAIYEESDKENVRLRSFRNVLLGATIALAILAIGFAVFGTINPRAIDQLSNPSLRGQSQPTTHSEIVVIEMLGLISATLVGALAIRRIQGTSTVYGVPMASLLLKLPTGALTALAGILMIRAGIVPNVAFDNETHLGAYALLFGASQQGFTGLVDRQAHNVLSNISSKDNS